MEELQRIRRVASEDKRRKKKKQQQGTRKYTKKFSEDTHSSGVSSNDYSMRSSQASSRTSDNDGGDGGGDSPRKRGALSAFRKKHSGDSRSSGVSSNYSSQRSSQASSSRSSAASRRSGGVGRDNGGVDSRRQQPVASPAAVTEPVEPQARSGFGKLPFSKSLRGRRSPKKEAPPLARRESAGSHNTSSSRSRSLPRFKSRQHQEQQTTQQPAQQPHVRAESNGDRPRPVPGDDGVPRGGPRSRSAPRTKSSNYAQQQQRQRGWSDGQPGEGGGGQLRDPPPVVPPPQYQYGRKPSDGSRGSRASVGSRRQLPAQDPHRFHQHGFKPGTAAPPESAEGRARSRSLPRLKSTAPGMPMPPGRAPDRQTPAYAAQDYRADGDGDGAGGDRRVRTGRGGVQGRSHSASRPPPPSYPGAYGRAGRSDQRPGDLAGGGRGRSGDPPPATRGARPASRSGRPGGDDGGGGPHQQPQRADPVVYC